MSSMGFHVDAAGRYRPVDLSFAVESEVRHFRDWRRTLPATDASELATLAAKRWFYYYRQGATVGSLEDIRTAVRLNPKAELAFLLVATAKWARRYKYLALAFCRRTWCHHLALDFLAVRPGLLIRHQPVRGLGAGMLACLLTAADALGIEKMWGEATASSAGFYQKTLEIPQVKDLFTVHHEKMRRLAQSFLAKQKLRLAVEAERGQTSFMKEDAPREPFDDQWYRECMEYEATHEIVFASPGFLRECRLIAELEEAKAEIRRLRRQEPAKRPVS